jgi:hypothetical protein
MAYARSSTLTSVPSSYLMPGCILKVQLSLSADTVPRSVRSGTRVGLPSRMSNCVGVRNVSLLISFASM